MNEKETKTWEEIVSDWGHAETLWRFYHHEIEENVSRSRIQEEELQECREKTSIELQKRTNEFIKRLIDNIRRG